MKKLSVKRVAEILDVSISMAERIVRQKLNYDRDNGRMAVHLDDKFDEVIKERNKKPTSRHIYHGDLADKFGVSSYNLHVYIKRYNLSVEPFLINGRKYKYIVKDENYEKFIKEYKPSKKRKKIIVETEYFDPSIDLDWFAIQEPPEIHKNPV